MPNLLDSTLYCHVLEKTWHSEAEAGDNCQKYACVEPFTACIAWYRCTPLVDTLGGSSRQ